MSTFEAGAKFANYTIEGLVAGGGMGKVYAARDELYGSVVALKVLHKGLHADDDWRLRFNLEGVIGQQLKHPHVVAARELLEHEEDVGIVLDLVTGGLTLHRAISREYPNGLPLVTALKVFLGVVQGVEYAHSKMVTHGDIKPENVLLAGSYREPESWVPKVTDFGTVGIMAHPVVIDGRAAVVVSPRYASPEHLLGIDRIEQRSDVYCLGLLLHYLVTGKHCSPAGSVEEAARNVAKTVSLVGLVDHPEGITDIVRKCTQMDVKDRYQSCRELAVDVRAQLDKLGAKLDLQDVTPDLATEVMEDRVAMKREAAVKAADAALAAEDAAADDTGTAVEPAGEGVADTMDEAGTAEGDDGAASEGDASEDAAGADEQGGDAPPEDDGELPYTPPDRSAADKAADMFGAEFDEPEIEPREAPTTLELEAALAGQLRAKKTDEEPTGDAPVQHERAEPEPQPLGPPLWVWGIGVLIVVMIAAGLFLAAT